MVKRGARRGGLGPGEQPTCPPAGTIGKAAAVAAVLNVSERRVRQLVLEGMPRRAPGRYDVHACARWYIAFLSRALAARGPAPSRELATVRLRQARATRRHRELALALHRGDAVPLDVVGEKWDSALETLRARMRGAAARLAPRFVNLPSPEVAEAALAEEVRDAVGEAGRMGRPARTRRE